MVCEAQPSSLSGLNKRLLKLRLAADLISFSSRQHWWQKRVYGEGAGEKELPDGPNARIGVMMRDPTSDKYIRLNTFNIMALTNDNSCLRNLARLVKNLINFQI